MPSSPNYERDYKQEAKVETEKRKRERSQRNAAHRAFEEALGRPIPSGYDVDHIKPLDKGGSNTKSNLRLRKASANRSYARNSKGGVK
jgi:hypothetical protein